MTNEAYGCPCLSHEDSFDGLTLLELGATKPDPRSTSDEDGHLENDDYRRRHPDS